MFGISRFAYRFSEASKLVSLSYNAEKKSAHIKMTNPKKRNTLSLEAMKTLKQTFTEVNKKVQNKQTKIVILEGQGSVFSSGHDLKQLSKISDPKIVFDECASLLTYIRNFPTPVICAVNGLAAAGGFQLTMACDLILATQKSKFSCPGVNLGLFCSTPGVELVRAISSQKKANQLLMFGVQFSAKQAYQYGILNRLVANQQELKKSVDEYIDKALKLSGKTITFGKKILNQQRQLPVEQAYKIASEAMAVNVTSNEDCHQGIKAFTEKRHPNFKH